MPKTPVVATDRIHLDELVRNAVRLEGVACDLGRIDVSGIQDFTGLFRLYPGFSGDISKWNLAPQDKAVLFQKTPMPSVVATSRHHLEDLIRLTIAHNGPDADLNHIDPSGVSGRIILCQGCTEFHGDFSSWNVLQSSSTIVILPPQPQEPVIAGDKQHLQSLIRNCLSINGDRCSLNHIDVTAVTDFTDLFREFPYFDGDISRWDTSRVTTMAGMFRKSKEDAFARGKRSLFRGDISGWDVANVTSMRQMFDQAEFNGDISRWNTSKVEDMSSMFKDTHFRGDISTWDTGRVRSMSNMFIRSQFNGDLSKWNVSQVSDFSGMFARSMFKGDLSQWDTSSARDMTCMFDESPFNGDISRWDVRSVVSMQSMFESSSFAQDISGWTLGGQFNSKDLVRLYAKNPKFLTAQSMSPWIVRLYLANGERPKDPGWSEAFREVAPIAKGLCLGPVEHANAIVAAYDGVVARKSGRVPLDQVNGEMFQQ